MSKRVYIRVILAAYLLEEEENAKQRSLIWVKDWLEKRESEGIC